MVALTIGMATYNDFDGVYFTLQALRLYQDLEDTELLVVDNYGCDATRTIVKHWVNGRYIRATELVGTAAPRDRVFREARGKAVLCCDSHILFVPGAIAKLKAYYRKHPETIDLLQGPLLHDDLRSISTHFEPEWSEQMWGVWGTDPRGMKLKGEPFDIPMQGLGVFSCRKAAWPGFNPAFRGFGGEEGYIHEKFRQRGGRTLCLPWLRWVHRFARPNGIPYPLSVEDKFRNYLIGHAELGLDLEPVREHFAKHLRPESFARVQEEARLAGTKAEKSPAKKTKKTKKAQKRENVSPAPSTTAATPQPRLASQATAQLEWAQDLPVAAGDQLATNGHAPSSADRLEPPRPALGFVFGGGVAEADTGSAPLMRPFPLPPRATDEPPLAHVARVARLLEAASAAGGAHFLIPTAAADWLADYPEVTSYLSTMHEPIAASMETGFLFALAPRAPRPVGDHQEPLTPESSSSAPAEESVAT